MLTDDLPDCKPPEERREMTVTPLNFAQNMVLAMFFGVAFMLLDAPSPAGEKTTYKYVGSVVQVDAKNYKLTMKVLKGAPFEMPVRKDAEILLNKDKSQLDALMAGDRITVNAEGEKGSTVKVVVRIDAKR